MLIIFKCLDKQQTLTYTTREIAKMRGSHAPHPILEALDRFIEHPTERYVMDKQIEETDRLRKKSD